MSVPQFPPAIDLQGKTVDLATLQTELNGAGISAAGLAVSADLLTMVDTTGAPIPPTPAAEAVVMAHVPPPRVIEYTGAQSFDKIARTIDATPLEIFRIPTEQQHIYRATVRMTGIDAQNGTTRDTEARMVFKRLATTLAQVGTTAILANFPDAATTNWAILPTVDGTDLVISVRGAAGRTIDWLMVAEVGRYAPGGLPSPPIPPPLI